MRQWPLFNDAGFRLCIIESPDKPRIGVIDPFEPNGLSHSVREALLELGFKPFGAHGRLGKRASDVSISLMMERFGGRTGVIPHEEAVLTAPVTASPAAREDYAPIPEGQAVADPEPVNPISESNTNPTNAAEHAVHEVDTDDNTGGEEKGLIGELDAAAEQADGSLGGDSLPPNAVGQSEQAGIASDGQQAHELPGGDREKSRSEPAEPSERIGEQRGAAERERHTELDAISRNGSGGDSGENTAPLVGRSFGRGRVRRGLSWVPPERDLVEVVGKDERIAANVAAARLIHELTVEQRNPTDGERKVLMDYSGWGGLGLLDREGTTQARRHADYLHKEGVIDEDSLNAWLASDSDAFYTPYYLTEGLWELIAGRGFEGGRLLENAAGTGRFLAAMPDDLASNIEVTAIEKEPFAGRILNALYGSAGADVRISGFEDVFLPKSHFDLALGNIPFGSHRIFDKSGIRINWLIRALAFKSRAQVSNGKYGLS